LFVPLCSEADLFRDHLSRHLPNAPSASHFCNPAKAIAAEVGINLHKSDTVLERQIEELRQIGNRYCTKGIERSSDAGTHHCSGSNSQFDSTADALASLQTVSISDW
jgi:hypothetical protein